MDRSRIEIKIEPKIVVSKETAEGCLKIVEMWVNAEGNRGIEEDYIDECIFLCLIRKIIQRQKVNGTE